MVFVGVREMKNRLTYYLRLVQKGERVIITDRGAPLAILHEVVSEELDASLEGRLRSLDTQGNLSLPAAGHDFHSIDRVSAKGEPVSRTLIRERR